MRQPILKKERWIFMKIPKILATGMLCVTLLTGCGASFEITPDALETYAENNDGEYYDASEDKAGEAYLDGMYKMVTDGVHLELWDMDSTENAKLWFETNVDNVQRSGSKSHVVTTTSKSGDATIVTDAGYYRILFCDDKGIIVLGEKDKVDKALKDLNIISK